MKRLAGRPQNPMTSSTPRKTALLLFSIAALLAASVTPVRAQSPTPTPAQPINLSTRVYVQPGDRVGIGGFIVCGTAPKHVLLRALGPSLKQFAGKELADPVLELRDSQGNALIVNDNWQDDQVQMAAIMASTIPPTEPLEAAIDATLDPGAYTAIVRGKGKAEGVAVIEVYDLNQGALTKLSNISTRAFVGMGDNIVIAGFVLGRNSAVDQVVVRGIGPSLSVSDALADPNLELRDQNGDLLAENNDWQDDPIQAMELQDVGLAPSNMHEAAIGMALPAGSYTALLSGRAKGTGVGLVEVYDLGTSSAPVAITVTQYQAGTSSAIERQHVSFETVRCVETFRIRVYKPSSINHSAIGSRAALQGKTAPIPFTATAEEIEDALMAITDYYAYGQFADLELDSGSFSYFASVGAINREPVVIMDRPNGVAAEGFTIEFGSLVGDPPRYNTWVAGMPLITIEIQ